MSNVAQSNLHPSSNRSDGPRGDKTQVHGNDALAQSTMPSRESFGPPIKIDTIVDIREMLEKNPTKAMELFEKGFKIYCDCFPDPSERESPEVLLGYLMHNHHSMVAIRYSIFVCAVTL